MTNPRDCYGLWPAAASFRVGDSPHFAWNAEALACVAMRAWSRRAFPQERLSGGGANRPLLKFSC